MSCDDCQEVTSNRPVMKFDPIPLILYSHPVNTVKFSWPVGDHCIESRVKSFSFKWWRLKRSVTETLEVTSFKKTVNDRPQAYNIISWLQWLNAPIYVYTMKNSFLFGSEFYPPTLPWVIFLTDNLHEKRLSFLTKFSLMFYNYVLINHISGFQMIFCKDHARTEICFFLFPLGTSDTAKLKWF